MTEFRLPLLTATDPAGQNRQLKSYLYQLVEQLNVAMKSIDGENKVLQTYVAQAVGGGTSEERAISNFNSIKSLIIKSADIVNAYREEIDKTLRGEYLAQSDFGSYFQSTAAEYNLTPEGVLAIFSNIQSLQSALANVHDLVAEGYIKAGELAVDAEGHPIFGLEIGQKNSVEGVETFNRYARFTSNRLSFFDNNDIEVAYISDYVLHITRAEVTELRLGGYEISTPENGFRLTWKGVY